MQTHKIIVLKRHNLQHLSYKQGKSENTDVQALAQDSETHDSNQVLKV